MSKFQNWGREVQEGIVLFYGESKEVLDIDGILVEGGGFICRGICCLDWGKLVLENNSDYRYSILDIMKV